MRVSARSCGLKEINVICYFTCNDISNKISPTITLTLPMSTFATPYQPFRSLARFTNRIKNRPGIGLGHGIMKTP